MSVKSYERELGEIHASLISIEKKLDGTMCDVRQNTEFRQNAKGALGFAVFIGTIIGGFILWLFQRLFR
jgi:hypothetical protein